MKDCPFELFRITNPDMHRDHLPVFGGIDMEASRGYDCRGFDTTGIAFWLVGYELVAAAASR